MKRLLALSTILIPVYLFAQGFGSFSHDQPFLAANAPSGPTDSMPLTNLAFWWVASDLSNSTTIAVWNDRIQGRSLVQATGAKQPFWTNNLGVNFYGSRWLELTNIIKLKGNDAFLLVCRPMTNTGTYSQTIANNTNNGFPILWFNFSAATDVLFNDTSSVIAPVTLNTNYEFLVAGTNGGSSKIYTNGIASVNGNAAIFDGLAWQFLGRQKQIEQYFFNGRIEEIAIWTNVTLMSAAAIADIHHSVTNRWIFP